MTMLDRLDRFTNNEKSHDFRDYTLDHVRSMLAHFGNPERGLTTIHIAGTNGKGSVAHMIRAIFNSAGYRTGLYTSPHLLDVNERISIGNAPIPEQILERYADRVIDFTGPGEGTMATYFDMLTVIALRYFLDEHVDIAIIETGLGGRLDSTNVVMPLCSVITDISMDHARVLGPTIGAITAEKAGIIKEGIPVITSNTGDESEPIIRARAEALHAPLYLTDRDFRSDNVTPLDSGFRYDYIPVTLSFPSIRGIEIRQSLRRQVNNSALAVTAALAAAGAFPAITGSAIRDGLRTLVIPGRFELLSERPAVLFDPAHNVAAMSEMMGLVAARFRGRTITLVLSLMKDKDIDGILSVLAERPGIRVLYYILDDTRCYRPAGDAHTRFFTEIIEHDPVKLRRILDDAAGEDSLFFFTGSFRLYRTALDYAFRAERPG
jgi:dihydrofolate synthase / folylpolyglutamate synthase